MEFQVNSDMKGHWLGFTPFILTMETLEVNREWHGEVDNKLSIIL